MPANIYQPLPSDLEPPQYGMSRVRQMRMNVVGEPRTSGTHLDGLARVGCSRGEVPGAKRRTSSAVLAVSFLVDNATGDLT